MDTSTPPAPVQAWLAKLPAQHAPVVAALRSLVHSVIPDANESIYHDAIVFSPANAGFAPILYIAAFRSHINLGFYFGGGAPDPAGLLIGSGKRMRHVKLTSPQECENPALPPIIEQAWAAGLRGFAERRGEALG